MFQVTRSEAPLMLFTAPEGGCIYGETLVPHSTDAGWRTNERGGSRIDFRHPSLEAGTIR